MKRLRQPQPCTVQLERDEVKLVHYRGRAYGVKTTLSLTRIANLWATLPGLEGERRTYHLLMTSKGEIEVYYCECPQGNSWFVSGWWD
jgi:hypothetical protein